MAIRSLVLVAVLCITGRGSSQPAPVTIDHSQGSLRGMKAFGVWLQAPGGQTALDSRGYEAVLASKADPTTWVRLPAGTWQMPAKGEYSLLLERRFEVSPWPSSLIWTIEKYTGRAFAMTRSVVSAGVVQVTSSCPSCTAWLLHETSNVQVPVPWFAPEMLRQAQPAQARSGVLMPPGRIAVALYDPSQKTFHALQAPVAVSAQKVTAVQPAAPKASRGALILELIRPDLVEKRPDDDVEVALVPAAGKAIPAALVTRTHRKIYAIWADLPAGTYKAHVQSAKWHLAATEVRVRSQKVEHVASRLATLPKLAVSLEVPEALRTSEQQLTIVDQSGETEPRTMEIARDAEQIELAVPPVPLKLELHVGSWSVAQEVDMSHGADTTVTMKMLAIRVSGRVYYGDEPARATLRFDTRDEWSDSVAVRTDEDGRYEAYFAVPRSYFVMVDLIDRHGSYGDPGVVIRDDMTKDFHLPANEYRFRVTNKHDGTRLAGAEVIIQTNSDDGIESFQSLKTDETGEAVAPPLRPGAMRATANAEGFASSPAHEEIVEPKASGRRIEFVLEPAAYSVVTLLMPEGHPAMNAEVLVERTGELPLNMRADEGGRIRLLNSLKNALVLIKAVGAARTARYWAGEEATWTLDRPAAPVALRSVFSNGDPAPNAPAILWIDGVRVSGGSLAWLTSSVAGTDGAGLWTVRDLARRPVHVLLCASNAANYTLFVNGMFDGMRKTLDYPWPVHSLPVPVLE